MDVTQGFLFQWGKLRLVKQSEAESQRALPDRLGRIWVVNLVSSDGCVFLSPMHFSLKTTQFILSK